MCYSRLHPSLIEFGIRRQPKSFRSCVGSHSRNYLVAPVLRPPSFAFRRAAQYRRIRLLTAFRAAVDIRRRFRRVLVTSISRALAGIAGLTAEPNGKCKKTFRSSSISASSSLMRVAAPFLASSMIRKECRGMSLSSPMVVDCRIVCEETESPRASCPFRASCRPGVSMVSQRSRPFLRC